MSFFPVLGFALEEKLCGKKCCKYFGQEGVAKLSSGRASPIHLHINGLDPFAALHNLSF